MQDEARHVAFGRLALRDYYPQITEKERDEREQFAVDACYLMRDRFLGEEIWDRLGLGAEACVSFVNQSEFMAQYRKLLFSRIVPTLKDIGLWGSRIQAAFVDMGVIEYSGVNVEELSKADEDVAAEYDALRAARDSHINEVAPLGRMLKSDKGMKTPGISKGKQIVITDPVATLCLRVFVASSRFSASAEPNSHVARTI
jgi:hypothetical protein